MFQVAISNRGQMQKLNASNFLDQLKPVKANASSENFERRNSYDTFQTSRNVQCPKLDGTSFLSQLRTSNNSSFQPQRQRDTFSNPSLTEAHSTTFPITVSALPLLKVMLRGKVRKQFVLFKTRVGVLYQIYLISAGQARTACVLNGLKTPILYEFIVEVILKITLSKPRKSRVKFM